jgi:fructokinase
MSPTRLRLGVDLGGSKIEAALLRDDGRIAFRQRLPTPARDYRATLDAVRRLCSAIECSAIEDGADLGAPLPLGIGTPGSPSPQSGRMRNCNSTVLNGRPLRQDLEQHCGRPVRMANDADCFTLSEASDGAGRHGNSVFGVILGTGVGGGLCLGGQLHTGPNGISGEWGHNRLPLERIVDLPSELRAPRPCYCGRRDCIETWLSGPGLALTHQQLHGRPVDTAALHADAPDSAHADTLAVYTTLLATALATVVNIVDPDVVVLGGGLSNIQALYPALPPLLEAQLFSDCCNTAVVPAVHGDSSGVRGAAWLWP